MYVFLLSNLEIGKVVIRESNCIKKKIYVNA